MGRVLCGFGSCRQPEGTSRKKRGLGLHCKTKFVSVPVCTPYSCFSESSYVIVIAKWKTGFSLVPLGVHTGVFISANCRLIMINNSTKGNIINVHSVIYNMQSSLCGKLIVLSYSNVSFSLKQRIRNVLTRILPSSAGVS